MGYNAHLQGKFASKVGEPLPEFNSDHPVHPALVHFPIAFNILSWGIDIVYALTTTYVKPGFLTTRFGSPTMQLDMTRTAYFLMCCALITTVPTIMSGNIQLVGMIKKNGGPWEKDASGKQQSTMVPRIKMAITHALMNDAIFLVNLYSWWIRRGKEATGWNEGKVPTTTNLIISMTLLPLLIMTAEAGASLVFNHGAGLNLGRKKFGETNNQRDARGELSIKGGKNC